MCVAATAAAAGGGIFFCRRSSLFAFNTKAGSLQFLFSNEQDFSIHYTTGVLYHVSFVVRIKNNDINIAAGKEKAN